MKEGLYTGPTDESFVSKEEVMAQLLSADLTVETKPPKDLSFDEHIERLENLIYLRKETSLWQDEVEVNVDTHGLPFFMFRPLSDLHLGAIGADIDKTKRHLEEIKKYPIYTAMLGDIGDFFAPMKHPEGMTGDAITPDDQLSLVRKFFEAFKDKILCSVQDPSHTDWIRQLTGIEPQRWLVEGLGINALKSGGIIKLNVNGIQYKGLLFHQIGRYNSSLNITNAGKRMLDMADDVDFVVSGHTHIGAMEKVVKRNGKPYVFQLGTMKTQDDFGTRKGLVPRPQPFYPTILFDANKKNIEAIEDNESATSLIEALAGSMGKHEGDQSILR